jgi:hypothetical protein
LARVHNIYITSAKHSTSLFWNLKKSIEEKKGYNIEKYFVSRFALKVKVSNIGSVNVSNIRNTAHIASGFGNISNK